ncbi:MAG: saccharopine dehydrogenase NADP-binding domain-containing protein [Muricauda sp.]|jgi:saccharopine dehydrogenase-like NADP-dependent oxidoreductase|nr:saccharopine dehydrogenase family protein [Allomuricauda sp.]MBO6531516.1 saccharopine dehydrogenase NADP-binding domain-containing protein [Allomuricauda sp.]MBO6587708.1 saccharopine dehydrogenase NADP-binding domain-containing protein [Allomuricauda sp.]MBO6617333.1 saccharopine dehydrogenase NADP-binding domain-containing protein [Allomuricauda sp.]MBO6643656.1 saccharopine dehydrogenase NADP-binding domain-containing protein [Allomuricauda sp.]MBO6745668.1 saccharopine dehydrogenase NA
MARTILVVGAGKSTSYLLDYLLEKSAEEQIHLNIGDLHPENIPDKFASHPNCTVFQLDIFNETERKKAVSEASIVVSMLPASLHINVAQDCLEFEKHFITASYVSDQLRALDEDVKKKGLVFMNEIGLDPGIDHMSAMEVIDRIRDAGGKMLLFESFTGGLVAPQSDTNLWHYKFTWNPRNVVLAGQGGAAKFIQEGTYKYIPYQKLFRRTEFMDIEGYGTFEAYANRDSLKYREAYGLENALTLFRGTMRRVGFSKAWQMFVILGMTDDSYSIENSEGMSYREFVNLFLPYSPTDSVELKMRHYLKIDQDDIMWGKLLELDLFNPSKKIPLKNATPAQMLQYILEDSWTLKEDEKDMIVMYHKFGYELNGKKKQIDANMVVIGENRAYTAMSKTVGLPVAMATLLILNGKITTPGVQIPILKEVYGPILKELKNYGISFKEYDKPYLGYNPDSVAG